MSSNNTKTRKKHLVNSVLLGCNPEIIIIASSWRYNSAKFSKLD